MQATLERLLTPFDLAEYAPVVMGLLVLLVVIALAWLVARGVRFLAVRALKGVASRTRSTWDDALVEHRVVERLTQLLPAIAAYLAAGLVFGEEAEADLQSMVQRLAVVWAIVVLARAAHALFDSIDSVARQSAATRDKPIRGYLQVAAILRPAVRGGASREASTSETPPKRRDRSATKPGSASIESPS